MCVSDKMKGVLQTIERMANDLHQMTQFEAH